MKRTFLLTMATCFAFSVPAASIETVVTVGDSYEPLFGSVSGSKAVFAMQAGSQADLQLLDIATGEQKALAQTPSIESNPVFAGDKIICATKPDKHSQADLAIADMDGNISNFSSLPGDEGRFWVSGNLVVWVNELDGRFSLWCHDLKSGKRTLVRAESFENLTHVVSNGTKIFWSQQNDAKDLDVWMFDPATGKTEGICVEPGDQYCVSIEGNYVAVIGHYVFRPDRDLFVYDIGEGVEIPVDSSQGDVTGAAISNGYIAYLLEPLSTTIDCKLMAAKLGSAEIEPEAVSRVPLTEKERLLFSWPLAIWGDKRDCHDKGIDLWAYDFNEERQFPVSFDPGDQYALGISNSVVAFMTSRQGKFSLTFKTLSR